MYTLSIYTILFVLNVLTFYLYVIDKQHAIYSQRRIPEAWLLGLAILGGAFGAGAGMLLFSHKTKHLSFCIIVPLFLVIWTGVLAYLKYHTIDLSGI